MRNPSRHGINFTPIGEHPEEWEDQLRARHIAEHLGLNCREPEPWVKQPAVSILPATRPALTDLHPDLEPFDLIGVATGPLGGTAFARLDSRPHWVQAERKQPVNITATTEPTALEGAFPVKTVDLAFRMNGRSPEHWALTSKGDRVGPNTRGKLQAAPTRVLTVRLIGKEGRRWRDTRNILPGPDVTTYGDAAESDALLSWVRDKYKGRGAAGRLAAQTGIPVRTARAILRGRTPAKLTLDALHALLAG